MSEPNYESLFYWVEERERIRIQKEAGKPAPWTDDEILASYRFCNVRREDDRVTRWIAEKIRKPFAGHPRLWFMLCIARQINWPDTLQELIDSGAWPDREDFNVSRIAAVLNERQHRGHKIYTGAYMISAPAVKGSDKQSYIAETVLGAPFAERDDFSRWFAGLRGDPTLVGTHAKLTRFNGWGPFMAYQAVVDMRFTGLLCDAPDLSTWAAAGPGTIRGLNRIHGRSVSAPLSQDHALHEMRAIYAVVQRETGVAMDFSDVPNILCETDKYLRVSNDEGKPRARYVPGRGA